MMHGIDKGKIPKEKSPYGVLSAEERRVIERKGRSPLSGKYDRHFELGSMPAGIAGRLSILRTISFTPAAAGPLLMKRYRTRSGGRSMPMGGAWKSSVPVARGIWAMFYRRKAYRAQYPPLRELRLSGFRIAETGPDQTRGFRGRLLLGGRRDVEASEWGALRGQWLYGRLRGGSEL